jgi:hypothetical protein
MRKLKTARQVREEIIKEYCRMESEMLLSGAAEFIVLGKKCYVEKQCLDIIKSDEKELDKIIGKYFGVDGAIKDDAGNVYRSKETAFDAITDDCYNTHKKQFLDEIERKRF